MKINFAISVAVILWENLVISKANFDEKDVEQHVLARGKIADIKKENQTSTSHVVNSQVHLGSSLKKNQKEIEETLNKAVKNKTIQTNNLVNKKIQKIDTRRKLDLKDIELVPRMTIMDLQNGNITISKAKDITNKGAKAFNVLMKISVDTIKDLFKYTVEDTQYLAEYCVKLITMYGDENLSNIKKSLVKNKFVKSKASANVGYNDLTELAYLSNSKIIEVWKTYVSQMKKMESISSQSVLELSKAIKKRYQALLSSNAYLQSYVNKMNTKFSDLTHMISVKYKDLIRNCLAKLYKLVFESGVSIKELANLEGKLWIAVTKKQYNVIRKLKSRISIIPRNMKTSIVRFNKDLVKEKTEKQFF